jgi:hypothetical protein
MREFVSIEWIFGAIALAGLLPLAAFWLWMRHLGRQSWVKERLRESDALAEDFAKSFRPPSINALPPLQNDPVAEVEKPPAAGVVLPFRPDAGRGRPSH